jgi:5-methylcytosine-specific restriction endonuclease McrA
MLRYNAEWMSAREAALIRDKFRCVYCHRKYGLHVHHLRPLRMGGTHDLWNLITLCHEHHGSEHANINRHGLSQLPGPPWEPYRYLLTDHDAVMKAAERLDAEGIGGHVLRELEAMRPTD